MCPLRCCPGDDSLGVRPAIPGQALNRGEASRSTGEGSVAQIERVLITGGCGFIGANLVRFLRDRTPWKLTVLDDLRAGNAEYITDDLAEIRVGSVSDPEHLDAALQGADAVVHLACQTGVAPSVEHPAGDFEGNPATTL